MYRAGRLIKDWKLTDVPAALPSTSQSIGQRIRLVAARHSRMVEATAVFVLLATAARVYIHRFGGTFMTPDSREYAGIAALPLREALKSGWGGWLPAGFPLILRAFGWFGFSHMAIMAILSGLRMTALFLLVRKRAARVVALAITLLLQGATWAHLSAALWSEVPFTLFVLLLALTVDSNWEWRVRLAVSIPLFLCAVLIRHAGIFFLPGLVLAFAADSSAKRIQDRLFRASLAAVVLLGSWMALNVSRTGSPFQASTSKMHCSAALASLNEFQYCQWGVAEPLCAMDEHAAFVRNPEMKGVGGQLGLLYNDQSPIFRMKRDSGDAAVCSTYSGVMKELVTHHRKAFLRVMAHRVYDQFGPWETPELGVAEGRDVNHRWRLRLLRLIDAFDRVQWIHQVVLVLMVIAVGYRTLRGRVTPFELFLVVGALAHAAGVALTNSVFVLRYMAIHKTALSVAAVLLAVETFRAYRSRRNVSQSQA